VVPRTPKLIAAAAVLVAGLGLAWPWRRGETLPATVLPITTPRNLFGSVAPPQALASPPGESTGIAATTVALSAPQFSVDQTSDGATARMVTVAKPLPANAASIGPFDAAEPMTAPPVVEQRVHIVHPGDSLERLAQRYLGDEGRAIEIFDLNRQVLENPHLLPIGAELKLPQESQGPATTSAL
jgi:nucleoid-associated protein YgaU